MKKIKSTRPQYKRRVINLVGNPQIETAKQAIDEAPIDALRPLQLIIQEQSKQRNLSQNGLMWASVLEDIADQATADGKKFNQNMWHYYFKTLFLPEKYDPELCVYDPAIFGDKGYKKWDYTITWERILCGSTTDLTTKGFADYIEQVYAFGATELHVMFRDVRR